MAKLQIFTIFDSIDKVSGTVKNISTNVQRQTALMNRSFGSVSNTFSNLKNLLIGGAIAVGFKKIVDAASGLEQATTEFKVLTGSMEKAEDVVSRLRKKGAETPFEFEDLATSTKLMMQFGAGADEAIESLNLLGDVAMGDKNKLNGLALVFSQVRSAGKLQGQDLMQMINQGFNPLQVMVKTTGKTMGQLREEMSKGKISFDMVKKAMVDATSEGGSFFKGMEEGSKTLQGKISTMNDGFNVLLQTIGDTMLPHLKSLVVRITQIVEAAGKWIQANKEIIGVGVGIFFATLTGILETFVTLWDSGLLPVLLGGFLAFKAITAAVIAYNAVMALVAGVQLAAATSGGILNAVWAANPIGLIVLGVTLLIAAGVLLVKHWDKVVAFFVAAWDLITTVFLKAWDFIMPILMYTPLAPIIKNWKPLVAFFTSLWGTIKKIFSVTFDWITQKIKSLTAFLRPLIDGVSSIVNAVSSTDDSAQAAASGNFGKVPVSPNMGAIESRMVSENNASVRVDLNGVPKDSKVERSGKVAPNIKLNLGTAK